MRLQRPVVRSLFDLIRFRNTHPAFGGDFHLLPCDDRSIRIEWRRDADWARLSVDLKTMSAIVAHSSPGGEQQFTIARSVPVEVGL